MHEHSTHSAAAGRDPGQRAGDADREAIGDRLRHNHSEGRLDMEEFQERIDRCYQAKTIGELQQLVTDLPGEQTSERRFQLRRLRLIPLLPILFAIVVISAVSGHHGDFGFWILIPLFFLFRFSMWPYRRWSRRGFARSSDHPAS